MKRYLLLLLSAVTVLAFAQTPVEQADTVPAIKPIFGYLSYDSALTAMPDYAIVQQQMAELREAYEAEMLRVTEEFNSKYEAFLEGQRDFPRTILLKRQTELQQLMQRNMEFREQAQRELQQAEANALAPLKVRLNEVLATLARERGYLLVINTDANACPFIEPLMGENINDDIIEKLLAPTPAR